MQEIKLGKVYKTKRNGKDYYRCDAVVETKPKPFRKSFGSLKRYEVLEKRDAWVEKYKDLKFEDNDGFGYLFKLWVYTVKKRKISGVSLKPYITSYNKRIKDYFIADIKIVEIDNKDAEAYIEELKKDNTLPSIKKTLTHINSFFKYAIENRIVKFNPFVSIEIKTTAKKRDAYTSEEQKIILENLDYQDPVELVIYTALVAGLRLGECLGLTIDDFKNGGLDINKQYNLVCEIIDDKEVYSYEVIDLKTESSERFVPLPAQACSIIEDRILKIKELNLKSGFKYNPDNLLFCDENGKHIEIKRPTRRLKKICKDNNIEYKTLHSLRHTYITRLAESKVQPKVAQALAGHKDFNTTMNVYTHVHDNIKKEAIEIIDDLKVFNI